jgi:serine/threonine protein kinase
VNHRDAQTEHPTRVGKYEIEHCLGGNMAKVYRARDTVLGRRVALKLLTEAGAADEEAKARFLLEARTASNIRHENIISVYDFGEENGRPFIVMEYLEGESLRQAQKNGHLGDFPRRMRVALQVARALDYIHSQKIIHRDIKPENVNVDATGKVKLMDFGIAKSEGVKLTKAGFTLGTPYYMAPEQVMGQALTPQADVYSFGVLVFELLTGTKPISGESVEKIFDRILHEPLNMEPLKALKVPRELSDLIARCTAKQPAQRPQGLRVVCEEIERVLDPARRDSTRLASTTMRPMVEVQAPTITVSVPTPSRPTAAALPKFVEWLPEGLRTQSGLMLLSGGAVLVLMVVIYIVLARAQVI